MRPRILLLAIALSTAAPAAALAQPADTHALAEDQFRQARELMNKRDYKHALELLLTSNGLEPGRGKLLNIALCEEQVGALVGAMRHFLELLPQLQEGDDRVAIVKARLARISPRVALLTIALAPDAPAETTVTLDGRPVAAASLGTEIPIEPGAHVVVLTVAGRSDKRFDVVVGDRERKTLPVVPEPAAEPTFIAAAPPVVAVEAAPVAAPPVPVVVAVPAPAEPRVTVQDGPPRRSFRWLGFTVLGVGVANVVVGVGTGDGALRKRSTLVADCGPMGNKCQSKDQSTLDAYHTLGTVATATLVAGGILMVTGVIVVVAPPQAQEGARAWIAPEIGAGTLGLRGGF